MDRPKSSNLSLTLWLCLAIAVSSLFLFILSNWAVEPFPLAERGMLQKTDSQKAIAGLNRAGIVKDLDDTDSSTGLRAKTRINHYGAAVRKKAGASADATATADGSIPSETRRDLVNRATPDKSEANEAMRQVAMLVDSGQWLKAESMLEDFLNSDPKNEIALVEMALLQLIEKKDPNAARGYLERAVTVDPNNTSTLNELLSVYSETGQLDEGLDFLRSIPQQNSNGTVDYAIANALQMSGRVEESVAHYEKALESSFPRDSLAKEELADAYIELGRHEEAISILEALISQDSKPGKLKGLKIRLAHAHMEKGQADEALRVLGELKDQNPDDPLVTQLMSDIQKQYM